MAEGGHLYVWRSASIKRFLKAGEDERLEVIKHRDDGLWLGYGATMRPATIPSS